MRWSCFNVSKVGNYACKKFIWDDLPLEEINNSISFFKEYFETFIPDTFAQVEDHINIKQEYIDWKTLKETVKYNEEVLDSLLSFINKSIYILLIKWQFFDITWFQWEQNFLNYKWILKKIEHYKWVKNIFNSTNFVIEKKNNKLYFVDNIVTHWIYNNTFRSKVYRLFILINYRKQVLNEINKNLKLWAIKKN